MADEELDEEEVEAEGEVGEEGEEAPSSGGKRKLLLIISLAVLVVVGGTAAAYFTGLLQPLIALLGGPSEKKAAEAAVPRGAVFYDLPELLVNLNTGSRKPTFLKIRISLELAKEKDIPVVQAVMPRIIDNFQVYLRELRIEDLKGSAGMYRLREELLTRVSVATAPTKVNDVLFREMLVQ